MLTKNKKVLDFSHPSVLKNMFYYYHIYNKYVIFVPVNKCSLK